MTLAALALAISLIALLVTTRIALGALPIGIGAVLLSTCAWVCAQKDGVVITSGAGLALSANRDQCMFVSLKAATVAIAILLGGLAADLLLRIPLRRSGKPSVASADDSSMLPLAAAKTQRRILASLTAYCLTYSVIYGPRLISRDTYFLLDKGGIGGALGYLVLPAGGTAAYVLTTTTRTSARLHASLIYSFLLIAAFSQSSRAMPAMLAFLGILPFIFSSYTITRKSLLLAMALAGSTVALGTVLQTRGLQHHGLVPYLTAISSGNVDPFNFSEAISGNLLVTIPITYISSEIPLPDGYLSASLNPLPGAYSHWYEISALLSINPWTPTNFFGQTIRLQGMAGILTPVFVGAIPAIATRLAAKEPPSVRHALLAATILLSSAAFLQFTQYSLRAGMRFEFAALLLVLVVRQTRNRSAQAPPSTAR